MVLRQMKIRFALARVIAIVRWHTSGTVSVDNMIALDKRISSKANTDGSLRPRPVIHPCTYRAFCARGGGNAVGRVATEPPAIKGNDIFQRGPLEGPLAFR